MADAVTNQNVGWGFPFRFNKEGRVRPVGGKATQAPTAQELRIAFYEDIWHLISTGKRERVMSPNFGTSGRLALFQPLQTTQSALLQWELIEQFQLWVTRLRILNLGVSVYPQEAKLAIRVHAESVEFPLEVLAELVS